MRTSVAWFLEAIAAATLAARRWGFMVGGWLAGLPLVSGPISIFLALEQGPPFASQAAHGTLLGVIAVAAFCIVYALAATIAVMVNGVSLVALIRGPSAYQRIATPCAVVLLKLLNASKGGHSFMVPTGTG